MHARQLIEMIQHSGIFVCNFSRGYVPFCYPNLFIGASFFSSIFFKHSTNFGSSLCLHSKGGIAGGAAGAVPPTFFQMECWNNYILKHLLWKFLEKHAKCCMSPSRLPPSKFRSAVPAFAHIPNNPLALTTIRLLCGRADDQSALLLPRDI